MKNPLHYQVSEYDCGPTTLLNGLSFLFEREEIPPEIIRNVMLYSLDCYSESGAAGKAGTSRMAMMFLANWLDGFGRATKFALSCRHLTGDAVYLGEDSYINDALVRGGAVVVRLFYEVEHYVLLTGIDGDRLKVFDPWFLPASENNLIADGVQVTLEHPFSHNRIAPLKCFNREERGTYALGPAANREAVLLFNKNTEQTAARTIEYFI